MSFVFSKTTDTETPKCFVKGLNKVLMADNTKKLIEDIVIGDMVITQNGSAKVTKVWEQKVHSCSPSAKPYKVNNIIVSAQHLIYLHGHMYRASDIGTLYPYDEPFIYYHHIKTQNGVFDLINVNGTWCETWDGYGYGINMIQKGTINVEGKDKQIKRLRIIGIKE